ncbi:MAG: transposase family protein [Coriobacteriia bacterium]|nr:transposase family protein [Actinomycetota bacterium]MDZ4166624.1 transposase family protein [Coriobacteriia bacterium]
MAEKRAITREMHRRYRRASKTEKASMLDELVALTGWSRGYASRALRREPKKRSVPETRGRKKTYTPQVMLPLRKVWASLDYACGKRVAAGMGDILDALVRAGELTCDRRVIELLSAMSAATIDRMLAPDRAKTSLKGRATTKPGTLLKSQIQIRTGTEWNDAAPGFIEIDLVAHCGDSTGGEYCNTLDATDIATGWTETRAVRNKAQVHVFAALQDIVAHLPFPLLGIDSDNGSEFINDQLYRYCTEHGITFTRSRAYRKNDGCHVEQKNWSVVRQNVGYARFDTPEELTVLREIHALVRLHTNFFMPSAKLVSKTRDGSKVTKRYDRPMTPYRRVLTRDDVEKKAKDALTAQFETLNPADLRRRIGRLQDELYRLNARKNPRWKEEVEASEVEYLYCEAPNQSLEYQLL